MHVIGNSSPPVGGREPERSAGTVWVLHSSYGPGDVGLPGVRLWGLALYVYTLFDGEYSRSLAV
jgi:hypothetical protein